MVYTNNFKFFDKFGNNFNFSKIPQYTIEINDSVGLNAIMEPVVNINGVLIDITIINAGINYVNPEIIITDIIIGTIYKLKGAGLIKLTSEGCISSIKMDSNPNGFTYPAIQYSGFSLFDKISVDLIENSHVFILEEFFNDVTEKTVYDFPQSDTDGTPALPTSTITCWLEESETIDDDNAMFLFNLDYSDPVTPTFNKTDKMIFELNPSTGTTHDGLRVDSSTGQQSLQSNIGFSFSEEGVFKRNLIFAIEQDGKTYPFCTIELVGETESEDERFKTILENFGIVIGEQEELIFRDSDISEALPNYDLLNTKRKEMLLENHNIFPYIGSYKALVNIINYFGYSDLRIKEYWINLKETSSTYLQYKHVDIPFQLLQRGKNVPTEQLLPTTSYNKTDYFGLFYDINKETGTFDEQGVPETEDTFIFTIEEILIKLFALKTYLKNKFLPLNARIIDITGEGIYFTRYVLKTWQDKTQSFNLQWKVSPDFETLPTNKYIVDITDYNNTTTPLVYPGLVESEIGTQYGNYVGNYSTSTNYSDDPKTSIAAPVELISKTFDVEWDEMNMSWNNLITSEALDTMILMEGGTVTGLTFSELAATLLKNSWDTIGYGEFIELEWLITHEITDKYFYEIRDSIETLTNHTVNLPYIGKYNVKLTAIDLNGFKVTKNSQIEVKIPNVDFMSLARFYNYIKTWDDSDVAWNKVSDNWTKPGIYHDNKWDNLDLTWNSIEMSFYKNQEYPVKKIKNLNIYDIWESSHVEGNILSIIKDSNFIIINKQKRAPELTIGDNLFLKFAESVTTVKIVNVSYINDVVELTFDKLPIGITTEWKIYRTLVSNIILEQDQIYDKINRLNGLKIGDFLLLEGVEDPVRINVENFLFGEDPVTLDKWLTGVKLEKQINIKSGEFGRLFKINSQDLGYLFPITDLPFDLTLPDGFGEITKHVIIFEKLVTEMYVKSGFTEMLLTNDLGNEVRILVKNLEYQDIISSTMCIIDYIDIDSDVKDISVKSAENEYYGEFLVEWKAGEFGTKIIPGYSGVTNELLLNFNDYPYESKLGESLLTESEELSGEVDIIPYSFVCVDDELIFTLDEDVNDNAIVLINGIIISNTLYTTSGAVLTLAGSSPSGFSISKNDFVNVINFKVTSNNIRWETVSNGDNKIFTFGTVPINEHSIVALNGMIQDIETTYEISDNVITFYPNEATMTLSEDDVIVVLNFIDSDFSEIPSSGVEYSTLGQSEVILTDRIMGTAIRAGENLLIWVNGVFQNRDQYFFLTTHLSSVFFRSSFNENDQIIYIQDIATNFIFDQVYFYEKNPKKASVKFQIQNLGLIDDKTIVDVNDEKNELYMCNTDFVTSKNNFDEKYAMEHYGTKNISWEKSNENAWNDLTQHTWDFLEYHEETLCNWQLTEVQQGGGITINGFDKFIFTELTGGDLFEKAVDELNNSTNLGISKYKYLLIDTVNIGAVAKLPSGLNLNYIEFDNGVEGEWDSDWSHTYPIGNYQDWIFPHIYGVNNAPGANNVISNTYFYQGTDINGDNGWYPRTQLTGSSGSPGSPGALSIKLPRMYSYIDKINEGCRIEFLNAISSSFSWDDTSISKNNINIPKMTTVFFNDEGCKIIAKSSKNWKIYDKDGKLLIETHKDFLIWKFTTSGIFDIELSIYDKNGNKGNVYKKGLIKVL